MMNNDCQEYNFSIESLLLCCNKPFHFCSKDTHIMFLLINFKIRGILTSTELLGNRAVSIMSGFTCYYYAFCS